MLKWLTIIGTTALIVTVIFVARYDKFHDTEGKNYDIKCTQSSDPSATAGTLICTAKHSQKTESGQYSPTWWHIFFAFPEGITALLLLLTLGAVIWQSWKTHEAAEAAKISAREMARQNENLIAKERAFLAVELIPTQPGIKGDVWEVMFRVRNFGATRAFDVSMSADYRITKSPELPSPAKGISQYSPTNTIPPEEFSDFYGFQFPDEGHSPYTLEDVQAERVYVHIYGLLMYRDLFCPPTERQFVDFHFRWLSNIVEIDDSSGEDGSGSTEDYSDWIRPSETNRST